ncbi:MAG: TRAP transporter small permease [Rhodoferax sp.]|nr:TRAP transporter small permease [Rhodoferax sp.]
MIGNLRYQIRYIQLNKFTQQETNVTEAKPESRPHFLEAAFIGLNRWVLIALLAAMAVLVIGNVISRYVFGHSFSWVEEATRYMMIWVAFLGAGPALRVGGHIAIDTLQSALPVAAARCLRGVIVAIVGITLLILVWLGIDYASFAWEQESPVLGWSLGKVYIALPLGAALMFVHLLLVARRWVVAGEWEHIEGFDPQAL